jgi:BlaI family penicillinase repressor
MSNKAELTGTEWLIIKEIWKHEPCAAPTIQEALEKTKGWSYSTVRTVMDRMAAKGLLTTEKFRNLTLFRSTITKSQAQRRELLYALKNAFNGALTPMVQCLLDAKDISPSELAELEKLIKAKKARQ